MTTLTLTSAPLPHPKSLAQQIFEPAQVNHEAVIFICETCERRGFLPPAYGTTGIQWLCQWGAGSERRCCCCGPGPVPASVSRGASPRVPRRLRRPCARPAGALPRSRRLGGRGESGASVLRVRDPPGLGKLQTCITCKVSCAFNLRPPHRFPAFVLACPVPLRSLSSGCVSETKCCLGRADKRLAETLPPFLLGHSEEKMGFRLETGKEVITQCLAGSWCPARLWRDVENHLSRSPPPLVGLPHGIQQQDWFAPSAQRHGVALWAVSLSTAAGRTPGGGKTHFY